MRALANLAVAVFNLVPAFPLDGGRLLRGLLWPGLGRTRATRIAAGAGTLLAFGLATAGLFTVLGGNALAGIWYLLLAWFLTEATAGAYHEARLDELLHGGRLSDAALREVETLPAHASLAEAVHGHFLRTGYGGYPVVRGEAVVGLLCVRDILAWPTDERETMSVQAAMAPLGPDLVVEPGETLLQAIGKMGRQGATRLLVMEDGRLLGMLTMHSALRHVRTRELLA